MADERAKAFQASIAAHDELLTALSGLPLPGQIQEFPDFYDDHRTLQYYLHPMTDREELERVRQQVDSIHAVNLGGSGPVQEMYNWLLEREREQADRFYVVSWLSAGSIVPRGLEIEGHSVAWTQNGVVLAVPVGKSIYGGDGIRLGTYERWVDPRDIAGSQLNVMAIYINSRNLPGNAPELPSGPDRRLLE